MWWQKCQLSPPPSGEMRDRDREMKGTENRRKPAFPAGTHPILTPSVSLSFPVNSNEGGVLGDCQLLPGPGGAGRVQFSGWSERSRQAAAYQETLLNWEGL